MADSSKLIKEANRYLVGGVNSPVRSFHAVGGEPLLIQRGRGARVCDYDGKPYIDYVLSWGSLILGHTHPAIVSAIRRVARNGTSFGTTHAAEIALARLICEAVPFIGKIRFVSSGTEAVMGALRLARAVTRRDAILKFEGSYHGHADYLLAKAGSGLATFQIPLSAGVPKDFIKHTLVANYADTDAVKALFAKRGRTIAAVIVEPVGGNAGVVRPDVTFLRFLREITRHYGSLLIFDEVITGFRFGFGSYAQTIGVTPDLICLGKIIGGGLPVGAYGGREAVMRRLAPEGDVYQASTFAGNPLVMEAGLSTLKLLKKASAGYERIAALTDALGAGLEREAATQAVELSVRRHGPMFSFAFSARNAFVRFHRAMLREGIFFAPSEYEANFLSFAHTPRHLAATIRASAKVFRRLHVSRTD